ncbi:MAG: RNA methyltransferase [Bacteroidia bacterium]|nr:RNA methyltransferase [Bacteroidota bacterium]MBP6512403.1 RNA methyltransferase [Bacteroidia bacterium]MBP7244806.1 RNA methyltransferase [Bacteroidia bacterium]
MQKLKNEELGRPDLIAYQQIKKLPIIIVLDNVRSALNVGSVFRSSDAFRVEKIILCGITAQPPHKEVLKTAIGATESVQWEYFEDTKEAVKQLKSEQVMVYAIEQASNSIDLREFIPAERTAVIFGHEMDGVAQDVINLCDGCIEIHQEGTKHSLNVSVCAGIICWELHKKMTSL